MKLILTRHDFDLILEHAREGYPEEVCGLVGGRDGLGSTVARIPNISPTPRLRFEMDRRIMVETIIAFQRARLDVVAIYHSHPEGGSAPSQTDIAEASWPDVVYLILDLANKAAPSVGAWSIQRGKATPAILEIRGSDQSVEID